MLLTVQNVIILLMAKKINKSKQIPILSPIQQVEKPKCPHCDKQLDNIKWLPYGDGMVLVVWCALCNKIIGVK